MQNGRTSLRNAVDRGSHTVVEVLVEANADVNAADKVRHFASVLFMTVNDVQVSALTLLTTLCRLALVIAERLDAPSHRCQ
jgi:hypothetical protein